MSKYPSPLARWEWAYQQGLDGVALAVLLRVCYRAGGAQGCTESQGSIAQAIGYDRTSIHRAVKRLEAAGSIRIDGKRGRALRIHPEINFPYLEVLHTSTSGAANVSPPPTNPEVLHTSTGDVAESNTNLEENREEEEEPPRQRPEITTSKSLSLSPPKSPIPSQPSARERQRERDYGVSVNGTGAGNRNGTGNRNGAGDTLERRTMYECRCCSTEQGTCVDAPRPRQSI